MTENEQSDEPPKTSENTYKPEPATASEQVETSKDARKMAMLCHLLGLAGFMGPLIVWLNEREKHHFVDVHGQEAINYHISMMIYFALAGLLCLIGVGIILVALLILLHVAVTVEAATKASAGKSYRYFIAFRLLK